MREPIKNALKVTAFLALALTVLYGVYHMISWKDNMGPYLSSMEQLYDTPKDTVDVACVGTSHVYCGILPAALWRDYGYSAFNMSISGVDRSGAYHGIVELLKTQHPKVVVVDLYTITYDEMGELSNVYRKMLGMKMSLNNAAMVWKDADPSERLDYLFRWPIEHTRYHELEKYDFLKNPVNTFARGEAPEWVIGEAGDVEGAARRVEAGELPEAVKDWVDRLCVLAEKKGFAICFTVVPTETDDGTQACMKAIAQYGETLGIPTYYGNEKVSELGIVPATDFVDPWHLNVSGAEKFTVGLGKFLSEHYDLEDHRSADGTAAKAYEDWDRDLRWYERKGRLKKLSGLSDPADYLRGLLSLEDVVVVVSLEGDYEAAGADYSALCEVMGLSEEAYRKGGKWLCFGGPQPTCTKVLENDPDAELFTYPLSKYDILQIRFTDDAYGGLLQTDHIRIGSEQYSNYGSYLRIVSYDTWLEEVIESRGF